MRNFNHQCLCGVWLFWGLTRFFHRWGWPGVRGGRFGGLQRVESCGSFPFGFAQGQDDGKGRGGLVGVGWRCAEGAAVWLG